MLMPICLLGGQCILEKNVSQCIYFLSLFSEYNYIDQLNISKIFL